MSVVRPLWTALRMLLAATLVLGIGYPLVMCAIGLALPQAQGSLVKNSAGQVVGSKLIGQNFDGERWFHSRPSAAGEKGYDALSSGATNLGGTSDELKKQIESRKAEIAKSEGVDEAQVPSDAVTASGSGLDPEISIEYARIQVARVARENHLSTGEVERILAQHTDAPALGFIGTTRVNVLELDLAIERTARG